MDFEREDQLASFCREKLNRVTARTLNVLLMTMRRLDKERDMVLPPQTVDYLMEKYCIPLAPCLKNLHRKFRDKRFIGSSNYELMMTYLEDRRAERQRIGPEEIREWRHGIDTDLQKSPQLLQLRKPRYDIQKSFLSGSKYID